MAEAKAGLKAKLEAELASMSDDSQVEAIRDAFSKEERALEHKLDHEIHTFSAIFRTASPWPSTGTAIFCAATPWPYRARAIAYAAKPGPYKVSATICTASPWPCRGNTIP